MKFLETITFMGNDALVPIDRIKYINLRYTTGYEISIVSDDGDWIECFDKDGDKASKRFDQIKQIIEAQ
jgi:hypothetical protein